MRYHYVGYTSPGGAFPPWVTPAPWEVTRIPTQAAIGLPAGSPPYHATLQEPKRLILDDESNIFNGESSLAQFRLNNIYESEAAGLLDDGLAVQANAMSWAHGYPPYDTAGMGYPEIDEYGIYAIPSTPYGWIQTPPFISYNVEDTWNGKLGPMGDHYIMRERARYMVDVMLGHHALSSPPNLDWSLYRYRFWVPVCYYQRSTDIQNGKWSRWVLLCAQYCQQYARSQYNLRMGIVPLFAKRKIAPISPLEDIITMQQFIDYQVTPAANTPGVTGIYFFSGDGSLVTNAGNNDADAMEHVINDSAVVGAMSPPAVVGAMPASWIDGPGNTWNIPEIHNWYNTLNTSYLDAITGGVVDPSRRDPPRRRGDTPCTVQPSSP